MEGHRQRDEFEGQTFARKLGEKILPDFISILDDPTRPDLGGQPLMGHFRYDDQGVPSQSVTVVEDGVPGDGVVESSGALPGVLVPHLMEEAHVASDGGRRTARAAELRVGSVVSSVGRRECQVVEEGQVGLDAAIGRGSRAGTADDRLEPCVVVAAGCILVVDGPA
ncbi:MAG: hypothetical protein IH859_04880 [Chloroflexi bacterium]|nr:hypothetical protein [Chloroflexota bacterium]